MTVNKAIASLLASFMLTACPSTKPDTVASLKDPELLIPKAETPAILLLLPSCPLADRSLAPPDAAAMPVALIGALVTAGVSTLTPVIVGALTTSVADALDAQALGRSAATTAIANRDLWTQSLNNPTNAETHINCIVLMRGGFGKNAGLATENTDPEKASALWRSEDSSAVKRLTTAIGDHRLEDSHPAKYPYRTLAIGGPPELYVEYRVAYPKRKLTREEPILDEKSQPVKDVNGRVITIPAGDYADKISLKPVFFVQTKSGTKTNPNGKKRIITKLILSAETMIEGKKQVVTILDHVFDLGTHAVGTKLEGDDFAHITPAEMPLPYPQSEKLPVYNQRVVGIVNVPSFVPVMIQVDVNETEGGGDIERAAAKALRENRKNFSDPVANFLTEAIAKWVKESTSATSATPPAK